LTHKPLPDINELADRILATLDKATPEQREQGRAWYRQAHALAWTLAVRYGVSIEQAAGVIAALSPNVRWEKNVQYAEQFLSTAYAPTFGRSRRNAERIVLGEPVLDVLTGPKERAFFRCIFDPERADAVCIDRHAHDLAVGERYGSSRKRLLERAGGYKRFSDAYALAARKAGLLASEIQAITWLAWRAAHA
jgi:hypothetical protein